MDVFQNYIPLMWGRIYHLFVRCRLFKAIVEPALLKKKNSFSNAKKEPNKDSLANGNNSLQDSSYPWHKQEQLQEKINKESEIWYLTSQQELPDGCWDAKMLYLQGLRKPFYGVWRVGSWIKMSATMIGRLRKIKQEHLLKRPKAVSKNTKFGPKYKWFKISYLECFFWKFYFGPTTFLYFSRRSNGHHQSYFRFSSRKSQSQQKLAKKTTHFTIQFCSKNLTHFTNHNSLDIENNMLPQHSQKPF